MKFVSDGYTHSNTYAHFHKLIAYLRFQLNNSTIFYQNTRTEPIDAEFTIIYMDLSKSMDSTIWGSSEYTFFSFCVLFSLFAFLIIKYQYISFPKLGQQPT